MPLKLRPSYWLVIARISSFVGPALQETRIHAALVPVLIRTLNFTPENAFFNAVRTNLAVSLVLVYSVMVWSP
ncbi:MULTISPECIES: hypothetical protein [Cryobacterium]|uniref:hypothetical protein n=1 Tax=Cryobacterium TaxID=69578 RepID=UPI001F547175|nr:MULTISPECIES: hypothetical protein [Cryobacterium]